MSDDFPTRGFIFWPVGTGDSTTVLVDEGMVLQVDLNHLDCAGDDSDPHSPIIDDLAALLPKVEGKPYLAVFVLTHPDQDHCRQFARLLEEVHIGEIWFSPRIFREYHADLCDDAIAFRKEAERRVAVASSEGDNARSGHRIKVIGYDDLLKEEGFRSFPSECLVVPGHSISHLDGRDCRETFRAFVHAPFKDDSAGERNDASVALQVRLTNANALLLGDLCYPTIKRIFDQSEAADLAWNVFLAPHHCSKSAMYWQDEGESNETIKWHLLRSIEQNAGHPGFIVASSEPIPASNSSGDNPPHAKAKARYQEIAPDGFLCTQEEPGPIMFAVEESGLVRCGSGGAALAGTAKTKLAIAVERARGGSKAPTDRVGFGR